MKIYVVAGLYLHTQAEAAARAKEQGVKFDPERDIVEVPTDRKGLIAFLNGAEHVAPEAGAIVAYEPGTSYTEFSVSTERAFASLSLAHRLHLATLALEDARDQLGKQPAIPMAVGESVDDLV